MKYLRRVIVRGLLGFISLVIPLAFDALAASEGPTVRHHRLMVELIPPAHELIASDRLTVAAVAGDRPLTFSLAPSLRVEGIKVAGPCAEPCRAGSLLDFQSVAAPDQSGTRKVVVTSPVPLGADGTVELLISYRGPINDPPRDPRHLRFVTPSETSGHIGDEGVYLSSETQWYPDIDGSLATFEVTVNVPEGWAAVTQGALQDEGRHWKVSTASEALTVVANRFVVKTRDWQSRSGQAIQLATYLFPDEASLADEYLDASARYLDAYIPILGPYPFSRFAVVENFFSSGLGMPSFTLLGSGVIKRHYTQPYALGHEIVHSWIGNGVFNRVDQGNWVEGLTTYLANYYYHELTGDHAQAREQRRLMLLGYGVYVTAERDYPVGRFTRKSDERDNAIGYQKSAMVFHALRQEIGEVPFWQGLRTFVSEQLGKAAGWKDIERSFQTVAGRDLRWFFVQWIEQPGAPTVAIESLEVRSREQPLPGKSGVQVGVRIAQGTTVFRIPLELEFALSGGEIHRALVQLTRPAETFTLTLPDRPVSVRIDPDLQLFRRIARSDMSPMLNLYVTDGRRSLVAPPEASMQSSDPFKDLLARIAVQEANRLEGERTVQLDAARTGRPLPGGSILVLAGPGDSPAVHEAVTTCGGRIDVTEKGFVADGRTYEGPGMALIASCRRTDEPGSVVTLLYGVTPQALPRVARLLFFYGWQSYVVFHEGAVVARGDWDDRMNAEVRIETN